ncbi:MAG: DUF4130 domain-containing protein [Candidatus Altiarchaeota archaeon]
MSHNAGFGLVKRHRDYDMRLHDTVLMQDPTLVKNCATPESKRLYRMQREVSRCLHAKKGFLRLKRSPHGILYARTELEHDLADLLLSHFHHRYPTYHIALEHRRMTYIAAPGGKKTVTDESLEEAVLRLEASLPREDSGRTDETLWRQYYDSQMSKERRNLRLMDKMMPRRYRDKDSYENKAETFSRSLVDYA